MTRSGCRLVSLLQLWTWKLHFRLMILLWFYIWNVNLEVWAASGRIHSVLFLLPSPESSWVKTRIFPSPAAFSCCFLSVNDSVIVMLYHLSFLRRPRYVNPSCFTRRQRFAAWCPLASCWTLFQSDMLALCWNYPPDFELSCKWAVLVLDVCCMAFCAFLFCPESLNPCALLMMNQVWVLLGGESGIVQCFDEVLEQEPSVLVPCSRFWPERQDSARTRGPLASPPINSPSENSPPHFAALRRCSSGWTSKKSQQEELLFHQLESETGTN